MQIFRCGTAPRQGYVCALCFSDFNVCLTDVLCFVLNFQYLPMKEVLVRVSHNRCIITYDICSRYWFLTIVIIITRMCLVANTSTLIL